MADHKNQHYVAPHYLKRFGGPSGKTICLCHLPSNKWVETAPISSQASADYFYGEDGRVEQFLQQLETRADPHFERIVRERHLPHDHPVQNDLLGMMVLMYSRTRRRAEEMASVPEAVLTETFKRMQKAGKFPEPPPELDIEKVTARLKKAPALAVLHTMSGIWLMHDLKLKLLIAPPGHTFVTSDHPVVGMNQAFRDKGHAAVVGLALRGLQLLLPISPACALLAYDPACYRVGRPEKRQMVLQQPRDVEIVNSLQIVNADEHIYFQNFSDKPALERLIRKHAGVRSDADKQVKVIEDPASTTGGTYFTSHSNGPCLPALWSFCSLRASDSDYPFGVRDPQLCQDLHDWQRDPNGQKIGKAFPDWMAEQVQPTA